jgi:hypothetical protein
MMEREKYVSAKLACRQTAAQLQGSAALENQ